MFVQALKKVDSDKLVHVLAPVVLDVAAGLLLYTATALRTRQPLVPSPGQGLILIADQVKGFKS